MARIEASDFARVVLAVTAAGHYDDITWSEDAGPPDDAEDFALEVAFVICNSGMRHTVARRIFDKVAAALKAGNPVIGVFGHVGKAAAIERVWLERDQLLAAYLVADDKLAFCARLPWIGEITKYHLAKNFGADVAKPEVHLVRLARHGGETVQGLCDRLGEAHGFKSRTVDVVLWRACAIGLIHSPTGELRLDG